MSEKQIAITVSRDTSIIIDGLICAWLAKNKKDIIWLEETASNATEATVPYRRQRDEMKAVLHNLRRAQRPLLRRALDE